MDKGNDDSVMNSPHRDTKNESQLETKDDQSVSVTTDTNKDSSSSHSGITMVDSSNKSDNEINFPGCKESYNCTCGNNNNSHKDNLQQAIETNEKSFFNKIISSTFFVPVAIAIYFVVKMITTDNFEFHFKYSKNTTPQTGIQECGNRPPELDYPDVFPEVEPLKHLDGFMHNLALRYGEEVLGSCYMPFPADTHSGFAPTVTLSVHDGTSSATASAMESGSLAGNSVANNANNVNSVSSSSPSSSDDDTTADDTKPEYTAFASFSTLDIRGVAIAVDDSIELDVKIVEFHDSSSVTGDNNNNDHDSISQQHGDNVVALYLTKLHNTKQKEDNEKREQGQEEKTGSGKEDDDNVNDDSSAEIVYSAQCNQHLKIGIKPADSYNNFNNNDDTNNTKVSKYQLEIALPPRTRQDRNGSTSDSNHNQPTLDLLSIFMKQGQVHSDNTKFDQLYIRIGRGSVKLSAVEVNQLIIAILDGNIYLPGVRFTKTLAAGVIKGGSTVLGKLKRSDNKQPYNLINMCADGHAFTYLMTTVDNADRLNTNIHIYRDSGKPPCGNSPQNLPGDVYYYPDEDSLIHADHNNSTNELKIAHIGSKDSGSNVLVYAGAKTKESHGMKCCNRFRARFYYNPNEE